MHLELLSLIKGRLPLIFIVEVNDLSALSTLGLQNCVVYISVHEKTVYFEQHLVS